MRFPALKGNTKAKEEIMREFNCGINDELGASGRQDSVLADCLNMEYKGDRLITRSGFTARDQRVIEREYGRDTVFLPFTVTDTVCRVNAAAYNLAYSCFGYSSDARLDIWLVSREGNILSAGGIDFHRVDEEHFFVPESVFFAVAEPVTATGVFLYVYRRSGGETVYDIYEANAAFTGWSTLKSHYYIPTVRINGRGERYGEAEEYDGVKLAAPERPEELNILTGAFKCYYSSDGFSALFRLPYGNLKVQSKVKCRLYSTPDNYTEWEVPAGESSVTARFSGQNITLYINRTLGVMRFWDGSSDYSIPRMRDCRLNNMEITAETRDSGNADEIISCGGAAVLDRRMYFYKSKIRRNCVYCTKQTTPLYFPLSSKLFLGDGSTPVTAIRVQNGKLIAFKPGETYRIITDFQNEKYQKEAVLPSGTTYIKGDVLSMLTIDNRVGCSAPETLRLCGSRLVWLADDGGVYALATTTYGNTTNIYRISRPIGGRLKEKLSEAENAPFAVTGNGQYMLFTGGTVFVMNYRVRGFGYLKTYYAGDDEIKSPAWYVWSIPEEITPKGGAVIEGRAYAVFCTAEEDYYYLAAPEGEKDEILIKEEEGYSKLLKPICSRLATKETNFGSESRKKRLDGVIINGKSTAPAKVTVRDKSRSFSVSADFGGEEEYIRLFAGIPALSEAALSVESNAPFYIKSIVFKYSTVGEKG